MGRVNDDVPLEIKYPVMLKLLHSLQATNLL